MTKKQPVIFTSVEAMDEDKFLAVDVQGRVWRGIITRDADLNVKVLWVLLKSPESP